VDATSERSADGSDVERYETLRRRALGGDASGWRLGLAVLQRHGVVAWLRAAEAIAPSPSQPPRSAVDVPAGTGDELVGALATMALACVGAG
jgi:hypothetical protein